jgi:hypothetical protein
MRRRGDRAKTQARPSRILTYVIPVMITMSCGFTALIMGAKTEGVMVTTVAGEKGTLGAVDGNGTVARFSRPNGIATLSNFDMVVADRNNHAIRYITAAGLVTTLAGVKGTSGTDDGTGTAVRFYNPSAIAVLPNGNFVVADYSNHAIRTITMPNGVVTTLAGAKGSLGVTDGTTIAARFYNPIGIAALPNGDMVVAEYSNHAIRYITAAGVVTTLAGNKGTVGRTDGNGTAAHGKLILLLREVIGIAVGRAGGKD